MKNSLELFTLIIISIFSVLLISCNSDETNDDLNSDCIYCTEEFRTITIYIKDTSQNPVALDHFEVINMENGSEVTIPLSQSGLVYAQQWGAYPLAEDFSIEVNHELHLQFKGFINNQEVITSNYIVSADCCLHVNLISGNLQLVL